MYNDDHLKIKPGNFLYYENCKKFSVLKGIAVPQNSTISALGKRVKFF